MKILRTAGGWPVLEKNWKKNNWSYIDTEIWMTTNLNSALIAVDVLPDTDDPSKLIIGVSIITTLSKRYFYIIQN